MTLRLRLKITLRLKLMLPLSLRLRLRLRLLLRRMALRTGEYCSAKENPQALDDAVEKMLSSIAAVTRSVTVSVK